LQYGQQLAVTTCPLSEQKDLEVKITAIRAYALKLTAKLDITDEIKTAGHQVCVVEIDTDEGITGHGLSAIGPALPIKAAVLSEATPELIGADPLRHEEIWDKLYWLLVPRGQSGVGMHAIAAIDIAVWDIKGKAFGQPVWRLLGGARNKCPVYATFGFGFYRTEELAEAATRWQAKGFSRLKMTVGNQALSRRDEPRLLTDVIMDDAKRVEIVRKAVGPGAELFIDANCSLDLYHARQLCQMIEPFHIDSSRPVTQNDIRQMAELRHNNHNQVGLRPE